MASISKTSDKCMKCPHVDNCDEKRMVACALMEVDFKPNIAESNATMNTTMNAIQITNSIINDKTISTQIEEQFKKDFYKRYNFLCDFNK
jgi:hypothetical protein